MAWMPVTDLDRTCGTAAEVAADMVAEASALVQCG
jgi:hypothetical protein